MDTCTFSHLIRANDLNKSTLEGGTLSSALIKRNLSKLTNRTHQCTHTYKKIHLFRKLWQFWTSWEYDYSTRSYCQNLYISMLGSVQCNYVWLNSMCYVITVAGKAYESVRKQQDPRIPRLHISVQKGTLFLIYIVYYDPCTCYTLFSECG